MTRLRMLAATAAVVGALGFASPAGATTGAGARFLAGNANVALCGAGWSWSCVDAWAPKPVCFGRGGGTWECYGGVTESNNPRWWVHRNCGTYEWIGNWGEVVKRRLC